MIKRYQIDHVKMLAEKGLMTASAPAARKNDFSTAVLRSSTIFLKRDNLALSRVDKIKIGHNNVLNGHNKNSLVNSNHKLKLLGHNKPPLLSIKSQNKPLYGRKNSLHL